MATDRKDSNINDLPLFSSDWSESKPATCTPSNLVQLNDWRRTKSSSSKPNDFVDAYINFARKLDW